MEILFLSARDNVHTIRWVNGLAGRGHEVHLASWQMGGGALDPRVVLHELPYKGKGGYFLNYRSLGRLLKRVQPDLMHVHYVSGYGTLGALSGFTPLLLSAWGSDVLLFPKTSFFHQALVAGNLRRATLVASTGVVMAAEIKKLVPDIARVAITPFGVDIARFSPGPKRFSRDAITIGTVKTLETVYGIDLLLHAFAILRADWIGLNDDSKRPLRLLIVGSGSQEQKLKAMAVSLGIGNETEFVPKVMHDEVPTWLHKMDIYAALSRSESFGVALLEASACGLPVVASRVGGIPEVVEDGVSGLLVASGDAAAAAEALRRLVDDEELRARMGGNGVALVRDRYSWEHSLRIMEETYAEAVALARQNDQEP